PAPDRWPHCYLTAEREDRWLQHSRPVRLRRRCHGKRRRTLSRHAHDHKWPRRAYIRGVLRSALSDHPPLRIRGPRARRYGRIHGRATQCGADAGGDRWCLARPHLAVFRLLLLAYLSVAATAPTADAPDNRPSAAYSHRHESQPHDRLDLRFAIRIHLTAASGACDSRALIARRGG